MSVRYDRAKQEKVVIEIRVMEERIRNMPGLWSKIGSFLSLVMRRQFATQGAYLNGRPWKPLSPRYRHWKIEHGYGSRKILVLSGATRQSFTSRPMTYEVHNRRRGRFGSNHDIAVYHQYGTFRNGKRVLPARKIVNVNRKLVLAIRDLIADYLTTKSKTTVRKYMW